MANKTGLGPWIDGLAVLQSVAKAVPVLGAPVEGSIEAVKQILQCTEVSRFPWLSYMALLDGDLQQVKNNKEDSVTLARHASEITPKLFAALKTRDDVDLLKPSIESFVK
jgi:hypothetical protein